MLAFHSRVWDKALLKGPLRSKVLLNTTEHQPRESLRETTQSSLGTGGKKSGSALAAPRGWFSIGHLALTMALQRASAHTSSRLDGEVL